MPELNFTLSGRGPMVVLSHALGCSLAMWDALCAELAPHYTVLRYDQRGHGRSPAMLPPFSIDDMADDAATLIERVAREPVHFVGLSMGGMVAQSLAARHPQRVRSIVIANSAMRYDDAAAEIWRARIEAVRSGGVERIADGAIERWFTPGFRSDPASAATLRRIREGLVQTDAGQYMASCVAVSQIDFGQNNARIACPTLVIAGAHDVATPPVLSREITGSIRGATLQTIDAAHLSACEKPTEFAALLGAFWNSMQGKNG